jgi:pyruvate formate-lyase activating enzyme-like uncharacterized protein
MEKQEIFNPFLHFKTKNMVQMANRLKIRAKNSALSFDKVTKDGFLYRGAAYLKGFEPGFNHQNRLNARKKEDIIKLGEIAKGLIKSNIIKEKDIFIDAPRMRLLLSAEKTESLAPTLKKRDLLPAIVKEYPTSDYFTLELEFI